MLGSRTLTGCCLVAGLLLQPGPLALPQAAVVAAQPVSLFDFESDALLPAWVAADGSATLSITRDPANVAVGGGAFEFAYNARPGVFQQISTAGLGAASANTLSLRLKASSPTSISLGVAEKGGAQYQGLLWIDGGKWVDVRVPLSDLVLAQNSFDDNGRLDADQIAGFFLADLSNLPGEMGQALGRKEGEQRIWLDDVALIDEQRLRPRGHVERLGDEWLLVLDDFESGVLWGLPVRRASPKLVGGAPKTVGQSALEISYTLGVGRWVGYVLAPPNRFDLSTAHQFRMVAKTDLNARLVVVLEERDGSKYDTAAKAPPDGKWHPVSIPFDAFALSDPADDENGQLDAVQIHRVIVLVDTFDADVRPGGFGSVVVDDVGVVATAAPPGEGAP
jgi:hypothetical protein